MKAYIFIAACLVAGCSKGGPAQQTTPPVPPLAAESPPAGEAVVDKAPPERDDISIASRSPEAIEHFKKGRELSENQRIAEAAEHHKKALALDPEFALAMSLLGLITPDSEGEALLDKSVTLAAKVPEPERLLIELNQASRKDEIEKVDAILQKLATLKPRDGRVHIALAVRAFNTQNWDVVVSSGNKAVEVMPKFAPGHNWVAYGYAWQGRYDEAVAAAKKQVELLPDEPNPYDTLAEVLLAAGRLDEALAAFDKAVEKSPQFTPGHTGAAATKALKGDWKGAQASLKKAHETAQRPVDDIGVGYYDGWLAAAQRKPGDAMKAYDAMDKKAQAANLAVHRAFIAVNRGFMLALAGKHKDALKHADVATKLAAELKLPAPAMRTVNILAAQLRILAALKAKKGADAEKAYVELEAELKKVPADPTGPSALAHAQGLVSWAKGDAKAAAESMAKCDIFDTFCRFMRVNAQRAAGDKAGAAETLAKVKASPRRDGAYVYFSATTK